MSQASVSQHSMPKSTGLAASVATPLDPMQEVRFAIVMYGGVSLAIYINGITQEMLHLVRATGYADGQKPENGARAAVDLLPIERVYRKLAYLAGSDELRKNYRDWLAGRITHPDGTPTEAPAVDACLANNESISTRFVIDILSGTSAGGINAIFLAKALANDKQIDGLRDLWVKEGDIAKLINDAHSQEGMERIIGMVKPPRSLLNSRRMYLKLLTALQSVDQSKGYTKMENASPYVDELDLFVTTTDIRGVALPLRLSDRVVYENRHRNVFRFRYSSGTQQSDYINDFQATQTPFLAFAARCTSSFPFAFEPMRLVDIDPVVNAVPGHQPEWCSDNSHWRRYFTESIGAKDAVEIDFKQRSFGDGGYLDNKPFTYVIDALSRRSSNVPVRRKLLYIEPSPEHPELEDVSLPLPNAIENTKAALFDLPRKETIREDLQRLLDRNRLIERADRTLTQVRNDVAKAHESFESNIRGFESTVREFWDKEYLEDTIKRFGLPYLSYRRMRIADATDELARCFTSQAGFDVDSDEFLAVRALVHVWRARRYADYRNEEGRGQDKPSINGFLNEFDLGFRVRRMTFIRRQIDLLHRMIDTPREDLENGKVAEEVRAVYHHWRCCGFEHHPHKKAEFKKDLKALKEKLNAIEHGLQRARTAGEADKQAVVGTEGAVTKIPIKLAELRMVPAHLQYVLGMEWKVTRCPDPKRPSEQIPVVAPDAKFSRSVTNSDRERKAADLLDRPAEFNLPTDLSDKFDFLTDDIRKTLEEIFATSFKGVEDLLSDDGTPVHKYLWKEFLAFEDYDQVIFPILYGTDVGESEPAEIFRISPEDATSIINERDPDKKRRKLAGTTLLNFGGFLDEAWRENDVMWGRLDGAERLITSVLPDPEDEAVRVHLISAAHDEILADISSAAQEKGLGTLLARTLVRRVAEGDPLRMSGSQPVENEKRIAQIIRSTLSRNNLLEFMREHYEVDRRVEPKQVLESISRSTQVIARMFEDMASASALKPQGKHLAWIARFASVFWGFMQLAVPGSITNLLFYHWFKLLVVFEGLVLSGGMLLGMPAAVQFGWKSLVVTLLVGLVVTILHDQMLLKKRWLYCSLFLVIVAILGFAAYGFYSAFWSG